MPALTTSARGSGLRSLYGVARYEYFDPVADDDVSLLDAGIVWAPLPWLRLKADYRAATRQSDAVTRGINTSISIVF